MARVRDLSSGQIQSWLGPLLSKDLNKSTAFDAWSEKTPLMEKSMTGAALGCPCEFPPQRIDQVARDGMDEAGGTVSLLLLQDATRDALCG